MFLNCGVGEDSWESLGLQGDPTSLISKGNFIGRTDAEAETPILWPPDAKNWVIWKDPDAGKDWRQEEKGTIEDEMVEWHHQLNGHELSKSKSWWWTGKLDMLQSMGSQRVKHDWETELNWNELFPFSIDIRLNFRLQRRCTLTQRTFVYMLSHSPNLNMFYKNSEIVKVGSLYITFNHTFCIQILPLFHQCLFHFSDSIQVPTLHLMVFSLAPQIVEICSVFLS